MKNRKFPRVGPILAFAYLLLQAFGVAQTTSSIHLTGSGLEVAISPDGKIQSMETRSAKVIVHYPFRSDSAAGPSWVLEENKITSNVLLRRKPGSGVEFYGESSGIGFQLRYEVKGTYLKILATIKNNRAAAFVPIRCGLQLGIDSWMDKFPDWDDKLFPTLLRCEKTHFWGYTMSPNGNILGIASPDPIASWHLEYVGEHRIKTMALDFLNALPLPARNPQNLTSLGTGEQKTWEIDFVPISALEEVKPILSELADAPMIDATGRYTIAPGETSEIQVWSGQSIKAECISPDGVVSSMEPRATGAGRFIVDFSPPGDAGVYTIKITNSTGKISEARIYLRKNWSWYLQQAREAVVKQPPLASRSAEWWYGSYTAFLAKRFIPDANLDEINQKNFESILPLIFDPDTGVPKIPAPLQKTGAMIGILVDAYQADHDIAFLKIAARIADWLSQNNQGTDGAYRLGKTGPYYSAVIYPAKSMLELCAIEKYLGEKDPFWENCYRRHYASAKAAIDNLSLKRDDIGTEGEATFEDGMISCSALQLGMFATLQSDPLLKEKYTSSEKALINEHRCLEQLLVPDCRMIGGTLRFWEAYHDLRVTPNMIESPHGWSSWKTYATYYMYLLTGKSHWLYETMDSVGSAMQMIDLNGGKLRWGFIVDPYVKARMRVENPVEPGRQTYTIKVIGEQYLMTNHDWYKQQSSDCDVNEHFKMMCEIALTHAFVLENNDGSLENYNCSIQEANGVLLVKPYEDLVDSVHLNFLKAHSVEIKFPGKIVKVMAKPGMQWGHLK